MIVAEGKVAGGDRAVTVLEGVTAGPLESVSREWREGTPASP